MLKPIVLIVLFSLFVVGGEYFYYHHDKKVKLTPKKIESHSRWLMKNENGRDVILTNKIIVKINDKNLLERYIQEYNASIKKELTNNLFVVKTTDVNQTLKLLNSLRDKEGILYAHPDLIRKRTLR